VAVPNLASWQARLCGEHWLHLDVPRHRWHFSPHTLRLMAGRLGLSHRTLSQFSFEYGPYGFGQSLIAKSGLGHLLFTHIVRPCDRRALLRRPAFWAHLLCAAPIGATLLASFPLELCAAAMGAGGCVVVVFEKPRKTSEQR
jgi:hypothetical protein